MAGYSPWDRRESDMTEATEHACMLHEHLLFFVVVVLVLVLALIIARLKVLGDNLIVV